MTFTNGEKKKSLRRRIFRLKDKVPSTETESSATHPGLDFRASPSHATATSSSSVPSRSVPEVRNNRLSSFFSPAANSGRTEAIRIFTATWNVGGKAPEMGLNLNEFLPADDFSDIYVLGFQEIVPLNAGNVLVIEDNEPAMRWILLINQALNPTTEPESEEQSPALDSTSQCSSFNASSAKHSKSISGSLSFHRVSFKAFSKSFMSPHRKQLKTCNCQLEITKKFNREACFRCPKGSADDTDSSEEASEEEEDEGADPYSFMLGGTSDPLNANDQLRYNLIACKQMVGIFVTVWARKEMALHIGHLRISCVGRGILGCLGNKGCISVSMTLHQTSFCFICSHLASGEKEGDELRRNSDVQEILRLTQFRRLCRKERRIPERILEHDRIIWLGDLNYRIALSYSETKMLLIDNNWDALFEKDQLKIERDSGRVFEGWNEGKIYFAPTYKYSSNSDDYAAENASKKKRRTPAWCDRILWHGDGIVQLSYFRGESKFSDHRPVCGAFIVEVEVLEAVKLRRERSAPNMRVRAEELLPPNQ